MDCLFCKIVEGKIPSQKVFESDEVLGFKDITPQAPIHYLFVPKKHYSSFAEVPKAELAIMGKLFEAVKHVTEAEGIAPRGFRTVMNTNKDGGQSVYHLHIHIMAASQMGANMTGA